MGGVSILRGNTDPICASTGFSNLRFYGNPHVRILGGSGSFQPYNRLCGYTNYLPMLLGADYLNTGGYNMKFPIINYCVPSTIGFLDQGAQTLFTISGCNNDISSLIDNNNSIYNLCGCSGLGSLLAGNSFYTTGGIFGGLFSNMFGEFGGVLQNTLTNLFGGNGSLNGGGSSVSWGRNGVSIASGNGSYIFGNGKTKTQNFGCLFNRAKSSNGDKAWSLGNGLVAYTKNSGNSSLDCSNLANIAVSSLINALC